MIDDRMTFKSHINHIAGKHPKGLALFVKLENYCPNIH